MAHDPIAALAAYWSSLAGGQAPERAQLDPAAIVQLLPLLLLSDFEHGPFRVRYRLTGTRVDQWNGLSIVGRYLDDLADEGDGGAIAKLMASYRRCHETARPVIDEYDWPDRLGGILKVRYGLFPLTIDGQVTQCLAIEDYSALPHRYESMPLKR